MAGRIMLLRSRADCRSGWGCDGKIGIVCGTCVDCCLVVNGWDLRAACGGGELTGVRCLCMLQEGGA